jgi:hypothetical protein
MCSDLSFQAAGLRDVTWSSEIGKRSTLTEKAVNFSKTLVPIYETTGRHMPEDPIHGAKKKRQE